MAPTTRGKRAASAALSDSEPAPATKQARKTRATKPAANTVKEESEDEAPVPKKTRGKAATKAAPVKAAPTKAEPKSKAKNAKAEVKAEPSEDEAEAEDAEPEVKPKKGRAKAAPKQNGKTKAATKAEPADDEDADAAEDEKKAEAAPEFKAAQTAKAGSNVPLDDGCHLVNYNVYIDPADGMIYDAALNQTNASGNNNKFYRVQLLQNGKDFKTWTRWGRVGERGQSAVLGSGSFDDAFKQFESKFKSKSGLKWSDRAEQPKAGKYVFVERSYDPDSEDEDDDEATNTGASRERDDYTPPKCTLDPSIQDLLQLIFNQKYFEATMASLNYDSAKLPLGKLSKATITRGWQTIKELSALLDDSSLAANYSLSAPAAIEHLSNLYYSTIPHAFGRNRPPIIQTDEMLKKETELLESLTDLKDADLIMKKEKKTEDVHILDSRYKSLGMQEMTPLERESSEFTGISDYLLKTCGSTHNVNYEVKDVFRIQRDGEEERFQNSPFAKVGSDRRLLWHGSRATNYGGILGQGLRIAPPEAPVNGYMFDKGIYLADMSSKSANYCCPYNSGGEALLLLCDAELGDPMQVLTDAQYDAGTTAKQQGMISTWGQGQMAPRGFKDAGCLHPSLAGVKMPDTTQDPGDTNVTDAGLYYNEFICYDVAQVRLRYLLRVKM